MVSIPPSIVWTQQLLRVILNWCYAGSNFQHDNFIEIEKWIEKWYNEEVGVDPEPSCSCPWIRCRTYLESFLYENYLLSINSSCIYDWVPCDHGSGHDIPLWFHLSNNVEHWSSISQRSSSTSIVFHLQELTPWYLDNIVALHHLWWILAGVILLIDFANPPVLGCR